jgi:xanthine dehydrogenase YagR molybdenum-binding subunit
MNSALENLDGAITARRQMKSRYDGRAKVTGRAKYTADFALPKCLHAFMVQSTIASGAVESIDTAAAERAFGVAAVLTPFNASRLLDTPGQPPRRNVSLLQSPDIYYNGQPIAIVIANTLEAARFATTLLRIVYRKDQPKLDFRGRLDQTRPLKQPGREPADSTRGDLEDDMARAAVALDETYSTPIQNHNSMETHATIAWWEGDSLNLYNSTQSISTDKQTVARIFGIPPEKVRVQCPFTGGGFGGKGTTWSHVMLAAMAARAVGRPVKLVVERGQMFGPVGSRAATVQKIRLGAAADGKLLAVEHNVIQSTSVMEDFLEPCAVQTRMLYSCESNVTSHRMVDMNLGIATNMRGPGECPGNAAFESALDELAIKLKMDPVELRLRNYAETDLGRKLPFTSKHLRECYQQAGERFGWSRRNLLPGSMREGDELIGHGMATAARHANRSAAQAVVRILPDGRAFVGSGSQDLGTGTYTIMADTAAEVLGLDPSLIDVRLGDTRLPDAPASTGSVSAASVCPAVRQAALKAREQLFALASSDSESPLHRAAPEDMVLWDGRVSLTSDPATGEPFANLLARNGGAPLEVRASAEPGQERTKFSGYCFGAVFVEVAVNAWTHMVKVRRVTATYDIGTLLNNTTGMSQLIGGVVWGISFALHEEAHIDPIAGRTVNGNFGEYHVSVNADVGHLDLTVLNIPDTNFSPMGGRGIGEISIIGIVAAIANAVYNATGKRIRDFPITPDRILQTGITVQQQT